MKCNLKALLCSAAAALSIAAASPAMADISQVKDQPFMGVCFEKVDAYGGLYLIRSVVINNSPVTQPVSARFMLNDGTPIFNSDANVVPNEWKWLEPAHLSIVRGDVYKFYRGSEEVLNMPVAGVPWYLYHCDVRYSANPAVNRALSYGLAYLDAPYVGGASPFRFGQPGNGGTYQMAGQRAYLSPAGVSGFDCSGLVVSMFRHAGIDISGYGSSTSMLNGFAAVSPGDLRTGDLIVKSGHVAIYVGDANGDGVGKVLEATPTGMPYGDGRVKGVVLNDASKYLNAGNQPKSGWYLRRVPGV